MKITTVNDILEKLTNQTNKYLVTEITNQNQKQLVL